MNNFGSDRREIFIAFAQSGSANSPHSQPNVIQFTPKNYRFTEKNGCPNNAKKFWVTVAEEEYNETFFGIAQKKL